MQRYDKSLWSSVKNDLFMTLACAMIFLMAALSRLLAFYQRLSLRVSIFNRVLIGNSVIIVLGAIAGTLITRHLTLFGNIWLILLFSSVGVLITLLVNHTIIRSALLPLHELGNALGQVNSGQINIPDSLKNYKDPDIHRLIAAINSMLNRLANRTNELQAISERAINAQEEERVRIARSLHDDTAQAVSMMIIHLERLESMIPANAPDLVSRVVETKSVATQLLENLREVIWGLRPAILDDLGLLSAIRWLTRTNLETLGLTVEFLGDGEMMRLPSYLETMLFRISQEAVSNIIRHAGAHKVSIRLCTEEAHVLLEIEDDGCGFDAEKSIGVAENRKRLGLLGIQERVSLVGGELEVESIKGSGTCLRVRVPLPAQDLNNPIKVEANSMTSSKERL